MPSLCCFWHPKREYSEKAYSDSCPDCGRTYAFPLDHPPDEIADYKIIEVIDRGFYGAIYVAERGVLRQKSVLKVVPRGVYEFFGKNFLEECQVHAEVAQGTAHLVEIRDMFDAEVLFESESSPLPCHVAVLEYVDGVKLSAFMEGKAGRLTSTKIAQIAVDLFRLLLELQNKERFHNDLHAGNLVVRSLPPDQRRADAIDPTTLTVAVDLGSITDASRSDEEQQTGDLHQVAFHLLKLSERLLGSPEQGTDLEYRLSAALSEIARMLSPESVMQRTPHFEDLSSHVYAAFEIASSPWKEPPEGLRSFDESYNAQTLRAWFVPQLLIDPGGWQDQIAAAGPILMTGMRGCGKTMLLRSLQFHARATVAANEARVTKKPASELLARDGYIGLYVSCTRLLDRLGAPTPDLHEPYARLFVAYAREALRALRHLRELDNDPTLISPSAVRTIGEAVASFISGAEELTSAESELTLERRLMRIQTSLERGESTHTLLAHPTVAFPHLAEAILACSVIWKSASVYFLLDDVSTRHLHEGAIRTLVSTLMFNAERCAFKVTTEAQTLELVLKSPGLVESARIGRDYKTFDLGAKINERLRQNAGRAGKEFILEVLGARAKAYPKHPPDLPANLLGDASLESIARTIAMTPKGAPEKKAVYHGITALAAVCVGDIGDVISIYEMILSRTAATDELPVPSALQSASFQEYCSQRLYHLNRRRGALKDFALGFAEAAHELLLRSASKTDAKGLPKRLRQYSSVYVRVTTGDTDAQLEALRELMDAGVFVLEAGPDAPRTKTRDSNPITQFILTYRKLFGLSNFIGLSERDRFELSGADVEEWLSHPTSTREILLRNLGSEVQATQSEDATSDDVEEPPATPAEKRSSYPNVQARTAPKKRDPTLFDSTGLTDAIPDRQANFAMTRIPAVHLLNPESLAGLGIQTAVVGRGFEERTLVSTKRLLELLPLPHALMVSYELEGRGPEVEAALRAAVSDVEVVRYADLTPDSITLREGLTLVDVTGLTKSTIFESVRRLLRRDGRVVIAHTGAEIHYPLNEDIGKVLEAQEQRDPYALLESLSQILTGEAKPYSFEKLLATDADDGRRRLLCAAASPKHERLMSLIDERDYDRVDIVVPSGETPRARLARLAADVATKDFHSSSVVQLPSDDLPGMLKFIADEHVDYYSHLNFELELALTGSKLHAVACAAACSALRVTQCWYVRPASFDIDRFTKGAGETRYYLIETAPPRGDDAESL